MKVNTKEWEWVFTCSPHELIDNTGFKE